MYPALVAAMLFGFPLVSTLSVGLGLSSRMVSIPYRVAISTGAAGVSLYVVSSSLTASRRPVTFLARAVGTLAGVGLCLLSASKGPLLELLAVIALQFAIPARPLTKAQRALYVAAVLAVVGVVTGVAIWASGNAGLVLWSRLENASSDPSVAGRWLLWRGAMEQFDRSPLLGDSFVESTFRFYPHNAILE